jgi:hypothetical protein
MYDVMKSMESSQFRDNAFWSARRLGLSDFELGVRLAYLLLLLALGLASLVQVDCCPVTPGIQGPALVHHFTDWA